MTNIKNILHLIEQAGTLMQTNRTHKRTLLTSFDTIASHSHHVSIISYCLARKEGLSIKDANKAAVMAIFHDLVEARTGDLDFITKNYVDNKEDEATKDQFYKLKFGKELIELIQEYDSRKTRIAQCVRDADSLAQMYHEWVLTWQGNKLAEKWFEGDFVERVPHLFTKSAKELAFAMKESNPNEWWWEELVEQDGKVKSKENLLGKNFKKIKK
jgi:putative hydrolase of HD superfamily